MNHGTRSSRPARWGARKSSPSPAPVSQTPLGDDRFQALLAKANAFFAEAERDTVAERAAAIVEIKALMTEYGLSVQDLLD